MLFIYKPRQLLSLGCAVSLLGGTLQQGQGANNSWTPEKARSKYLLGALQDTGAPARTWSKEPAEEFKTALQSLSDRAHRTFLVEGGLPTKTPEAKAQLLNDALSRFLSRTSDAPTLDQTVQKVADAYDYTFTQNGAVFVFQKQYSNPDDLICVSLEEWQASIDDATRMISHFSPSKTGYMTSITDDTRLIASFTPEQTRLLAQPGLSVSALAPAQKAYLKNVCLFMYLGPSTGDLLNAQGHTRCVLDEQTGFGWYPFFKNKLFGYRGVTATAVTPAGVPLTPYFRPLSHPSQFPSRINNSVGDFSSNASALIADDTIDETRPAPSPITQETVTRAAPSASVTLQTATVALNARNAASSSLDAFTYVVDPAFLSKEILVVGDGYASPAALFAAMGKLYGLLARTDTKARTVTLSRHRLQMPSDVEGIPDEMRRILPDPFLRALRKRMGSPWRIAATRRLRESVEPVLSARKEKHVPLKFVDDMGRVALANIMMADVSEFIGKFFLEPPDYITDSAALDALSLTCRPYVEKKKENGVETEVEWVSVQFGNLRPNGTMAFNFTYSVRRSDVDKIKVTQP